MRIPKYILWNDGDEQRYTYLNLELDEPVRSKGWLKSDKKPIYTKYLNNAKRMKLIELEAKEYEPIYVDVVKVSSGQIYGEPDPGYYERLRKGNECLIRLDFIKEVSFYAVDDFTAPSRIEVISSENQRYYCDKKTVITKLLKIIRKNLIDL